MRELHNLKTFIKCTSFWWAITVSWTVFIYTKIFNFTIISFKSCETDALL